MRVAGLPMWNERIMFENGGEVKGKKGNRVTHQTQPQNSLGASDRELPCTPVGI